MVEQRDYESCWTIACFLDKKKAEEYISTLDDKDDCRVQEMDTLDESFNINKYKRFDWYTASWRIDRKTLQTQLCVKYFWQMFENDPKKPEHDIYFSRHEGEWDRVVFISTTEFYEENNPPNEDEIKDKMEGYYRRITGLLEEGFTTYEIAKQPWIVFDKGDRNV